jgi:DNA-binding PadR family transcriptional regulator
MSPVFRHGGLRLYLLKLLDEAPRHGYDVIRLLQDKFLGVYSPSPGTIYPRLARLEEEGLVTHDVVDGKKVYKITDAGREELHRRLDDLAELEDELAASVRDIAKELTRDVRETVRSLRDELTWAVRESSRAGRPGRDNGPARPERPERPERQERQERPERPEPAQRPAGPPPAGPPAPATRPGGADRPGDPGDGGSDERAGSGSVWDRARDEAESADLADGAARGASPGRSETGSGRPGQDQADDSDQRRRPGDWREWAAWAERHDWREWVTWAERHGWHEWPAWARQQDWAAWAARPEWKERARTGRQEWADWTRATRETLSPGAPRTRRQSDADLFSDLERLAAAFAREVRGAARHAETVSDGAVGNLGNILTDALNRIRAEVFGAPGAPGHEPAGHQPPDQPGRPADSKDSAT